MAAQLEEQQEKLRRAVDEWRSRTHHLLKNFRGDPSGQLPSSSAAGSSSSSSHPIQLHVEPLEHFDLSSLLQSDNAAVSKFITVLSFDCIEISRLQKLASRNLYTQLLLFGHRSSAQEVPLEGEPQKAFAKSMPLFMELYETSTRMTDVLRNLIQQLNSIYSCHDRNFRPLNSVRNFTLRTAFECLGEGLSVLLVLDEILKQNSHIKSCLSLFARMLNNMKLEVGTFDTSIEDLDILVQIVGHLEKLLACSLLQRIWQEESSWWQQVKCNRKLLEACNSCIYEGLSEILPRLYTWKESPFDRRKILHHVALLLFSAYASGEAPEKKMGKFVLEMLQLVPVVHLECGKRIVLLDLLKSQCFQPLSSWPPLREAFREYDLTMRNYLTRLSEMHVRDWQAIKHALSSWVASFQSTMHPLSDMSSDTRFRLHLKQVMEGILLARRMHMLVLSIIDLHALLEVPIKREKLSSLSHMVISLKVLGSTFRIKGPEITQTLPHIINIIQADIEQLILPSKAKLHLELVKASKGGMFRILSSLTSGGKGTETKLPDSLTLVLISLQLLQGGGSCRRQLILSITLDVLQSIDHLVLDFSRIRKYMLKLATVVDFQSLVEEFTNCSFLYWRKETIENLFSMVYLDVNKFSWLQYLVDAFLDGLWLLKLARVGKLTLQSYEKEIENAIRNGIIEPLCRDIETDLRLHVHSTRLKGSVHVNPTKTGVRNLSWYLQMRPLRLPFKFIDVGSLVESYLNSAFYNHLAMASNDWKMYSEMQQLAELKYGLVLDDISLAEHSVDQDFDINEILKYMGTFAEIYSYNIVRQVFVQKVPTSQGRKNVRLIDVEQVASSIATRGLRVISTASTLIFEYTTQMFAALSESLNDDYFRSHLSKESNFWKNDNGSSSMQASVHPGDVNVAIGKFSLRDYGVSFLERLQSILTKLGNALGLMRIFLSGGFRHSCNLSWFISRPRFVEGWRKLGFPDEIVAAAKVMDTAIENAYQSYDHIKSFSFVIDSFLKEHQRSTCHHHSDFFLVVPPLIVNMIHSKVQYMDKSLRRDHDSGNIVKAYDGFIMGAVYVLKVMGQEKSFDELDWFSSAKKNLEESILALQISNMGPEQRKGSSFVGLKLWSRVPSISSEAQKGIDRQKRYIKEIELIECCYNVARTIMSLS